MIKNLISKTCHRPKSLWSDCFHFLRFLNLTGGTVSQRIFWTLCYSSASILSNNLAFGNNNFLRTVSSFRFSPIFPFVHPFPNFYILGREAFANYFLNTALVRMKRLAHKKVILILFGDSKINFTGL